ncbi:ATP-binding protein [Gryllotalpicola sp.]|uniref:sensor histidine kinase n=1 Tax=Gryllotalpicola sp. TaxID=1932787 RepID=UPI0026252774|nr:ATP-binding protein [Gryllotalpicola sp.]
MPRILLERDRLLSTGARALGLVAAIVAAVCLSLPGASVSVPGQIAAVALLVAAGVGFAWRLEFVSTVLWAVLIDALAFSALVVVALAFGPLNTATAYAVPWIVGGVMAAPAIVLITSPPRIVLCATTFVFAMAGLGFAARGDASLITRMVAFSLAGWFFGVVLAVWIGRIVPQTIVRIASMSEAYRAERLASETEARRRQGARLLHDTVLATLTLLAHSGVGVSESALREQAAQDSALLRQLRLGYTPNPAASGTYRLQPVAESSLGNTLESVKQRFQRMGLEVKWHGTGQVLLPSDTLDAFLLALSESLENVRRHAGVDEAHVTITDDEVAVRALITDNGVGFEPAEVPLERLGYTESIVARIRDVGGTARLFTARGAGTTVVLEVPK